MYFDIVRPSVHTQTRCDLPQKPPGENPGWLSLWLGGLEQAEGFGALDGFLADGEEGFVCCYKMLDGRQLWQHPLQLMVDVVQLCAVGRPVHRGEDQLFHFAGGKDRTQLGHGGVDMGFLQTKGIYPVCYSLQPGKALRLHLRKAGAGDENRACRLVNIVR